VPSKPGNRAWETLRRGEGFESHRILVRGRERHSEGGEGLESHWIPVKVRERHSGRGEELGS